MPAPFCGVRRRTLGDVDTPAARWLALFGVLFLAFLAAGLVIDDVSAPGALLMAAGVATGIVIGEARHGRRS